MRREATVAAAIAVLCLALVVTNRAYFSAANLTDLMLANVAVLVAALGVTFVVIAGQIDISIGSIFAISSVLAGVAAVDGLALPAVAAIAVLTGAALGAMNGALVSWVGVPSIVVTLATMIGLRDGLRWITQGAWV